MKKFRNTFIKCFSLVLFVLCLVSVVACGNKKVTISLSSSANTIKIGETVDLTVEVKNTDDKTYTYSVDPADVISIKEDKVSVVKGVKEDVVVTITVTSNADKNISKSIKLTVKAEVVNVVKMDASLSKDTIKKGETANLTVTITGSSDTSYTVESSHPKIIAITNGIVSVIGNVVLDKVVNITVTANADKSVTKTVTIIVKSETQGGEVNGLTSTMIEALGNESITVKGVLEDVYVDFNQSDNNRNHKYGMTVEMSKDAWRGSWYSLEQKDNVITDNYRKSEKDGLKNQKGEVGHGLEKVYINRNNKVARSLVKDYVSIPTIWESQHLWNHLGQLNVNKFKFNEDEQRYEYSVDVTNEEDLYLMTYLSFSLTPMLSDTLSKIFLVVEDGQITKLIGQTEILYYGADVREDADAMSYTTIEVEFSKIGTTIVGDPTPYEAPENAELLTTALTKMKELKNYTFNIVETQINSPSVNYDEYQTLSATSNSKVFLARKNAENNDEIKNFTSQVGTVGLIGKVTEEGALFAQTSMYLYTMDDKPYHTEYSGYKQNSDNTFDYFEYDTKLKALAGKRKYTGSYFQELPKFDFSADIFTFEYATSKDGKMYYVFKLRDSAITREIAEQLTIKSYGHYGEASVSTTLSIKVDGEGNLVSAVFPYSISGIYSGYYTVNYSKFNTTELPVKTFVGYVPREIKNSWGEYTTKYYTATNSTKDTHDEVTTVVLEDIFGDAVSYFPTPEVFISVLGDAISGPFFDFTQTGSDSDGNPIYRKSISIKMTSSNYDENMQITDFEEIIEEFTEVLGTLGFKISQANTDTSGGKTGRADRYVTFIYQEIMIVFSNNHTKFIDIDFYRTGEWTLKKSN